MSRQSPYRQGAEIHFLFASLFPPNFALWLAGGSSLKSLQTTDKQVAIPLALRLAATTKQVFNNLKKDMPDPAKREKLLQLLREQKAKQPLMRKIEEKEEEIEELKNLNWHKVKQIKLEAENEISKLKAQNEAFKLALVAFQASSRATPSSTVENALEALETNAKPIAVTKKTVFHKLSEIIPVWQRLKKPSISTVEVYQLAVNRFEEHFPELYAEKIEKRHIREYVAWLQSEKKSPKTIEKEHGAIRALLSIAEHEDWIESNPAKGIMLPALKGKKVRSFTT